MSRVSPPRVALLLVFLASLSATGWAAEPVAEVTLVCGAAEVVRAADSSVMAARPDLELFAGDVVRTKVDGKVEIKFGEGALLRLAENTEVKLNQTPEKSGVMVLAGKLWAHIKRLFGRSRFEVETPAAVAGVRGTTLRATVLADHPDQAIFAVDEGEIEVAAGSQRFMVPPLRQVTVWRTGRAMGPFDAQTRQPWEFWTDPLVTERLIALKAQARQRLEAALACRKGILDLQASLATDLGAAQRVRERALGLQQSITEVGNSLAELRRQQEGLDRLGRRAPPAKAQRERTRIANQARALMTRGKAIAQQLTTVNRVLGRGQELQKGRLQAMQALSKQAADLMGQHQELRQRLLRLGMVRRLDPHWPQFEPLHNESAVMERDLGQYLTEAQQWVGEGENLPGPYPRGAGRHLKMLGGSLQQVQELLGANQQTWGKTEPDLSAFAASFGGKGRGGGPR